MMFRITNFDISAQSESSMSIVHEASTSNSTSSGTSITVPFPATVNADDDLLIFLVMDQKNASASSADNGFTKLADDHFLDGSDSVYAAVFHKVAAGTETGNVTIDLDGKDDGATVVMERYSGSDGGTPTASISAGLSTTTPGAPGEVLSAEDYKVIVCTHYNSNGNRYSAVPTGYTIRSNEGNNGSGAGIATADKDQTGDASTTYGNETWTLTAAVTSFATHVALKVATGGDDHTLATNELSVSTLLDTSSIVQNHVLTPVDSSVTVSLDSTTLDQVGILAPDALSVTVSLDTTIITQVHTLSPDDLSSASTLDATTITPENDDHTLAPDDLSVSICDRYNQHHASGNTKP